MHKEYRSCRLHASCCEIACCLLAELGSCLTPTDLFQQRTPQGKLVPASVHASLLRWWCVHKCVHINCVCLMSTLIWATSQKTLQVVFLAMTLFVIYTATHLQDLSTAKINRSNLQSLAPAASQSHSSFSLNYISNKGPGIGETVILTASVLQVISRRSQPECLDRSATKKFGTLIVVSEIWNVSTDAMNRMLHLKGIAISIWKKDITKHDF